MGFNVQRLIDLHVHSTASDGTLEPLQIIDAAMAAGLSAVSLTDHDTIEGCRQVLAEPSPPPLDFLSGVEISAAFPQKIHQAGSIHILGYDIDVEDLPLNRVLAELRTARNNRSPAIIRRLNEIGLDLDVEDVVPFARGNQMGRPHIARALLEKGLISSIDEAFDKYIGKNGPAYVDKERIPCAAAIELIENAGGVPVLAHPGIIELSENENVFDLLDLLIDKGIKGLEVYYPGHSQRQTAYFLDFARRRGLLVTGGTDFHGGLNPAIHLGSGTGDLTVDYRLYQELIAFNRNKTKPS